MSITDELREYFGKSKGMFTDHVLAIADRIDERVKNIRFNEHHKGYQDGIMDGCSHYDPEHTECMVSEEHGYIKLPKDADGEPIHVGDVMEWARYEDDDPTIVREVSAIGDGVFFAWSSEQGRYAQYEAHAYRHHHAPTVEDVLRKFVERWHDTHHDDMPALFAEFAAKLRLAEVEDA